jgi:hypothetical protein
MIELNDDSHELIRWIENYEPLYMEVNRYVRRYDESFDYGDVRRLAAQIESVINDLDCINTIPYFMQDYDIDGVDYLEVAQWYLENQ